MSEDVGTDGIAAALFASVGLLVRRIRQVPTEGGLAMPERQALSLLDRGGPASSSELARQAQITAQAMGTTLGALQTRGLVERRPDPKDGRRVILTVTAQQVRALSTSTDPKTVAARKVCEALLPTGAPGGMPAATPSS